MCLQHESFSAAVPPIHKMVMTPKEKLCSPKAKYILMDTEGVFVLDLPSGFVLMRCDHSGIDPSLSTPEDNAQRKALYQRAHVIVIVYDAPSQVWQALSHLISIVTCSFRRP
jgi:hypothetical protein